MFRIDVFGENARTIVWMDSKEFGKVAVVCVGAMLVGSIIITAKVGSELKRADEMGYFAFGGSTLVVVFEKGKMNFDRDLLENSDRTVETLVGGIHVCNPGPCCTHPIYRFKSVIILADCHHSRHNNSIQAYTCMNTPFPLFNYLFLFTMMMTMLYMDISTVMSALKLLLLPHQPNK